MLTSKRTYSTTNGFKLSAFPSTSNSIIWLHNSLILIGQAIFWLARISGPKKNRLISPDGVRVISTGQAGHETKPSYGWSTVPIVLGSWLFSTAVTKPLSCSAIMPLLLKCTYISIAWKGLWAASQYSCHPYTSEYAHVTIVRSFTRLQQYIWANKISCYKNLWYIIPQPQSLHSSHTNTRTQTHTQILHTHTLTFTV